MAATLFIAPSLDAALEHAVSRVRHLRRDRPLRRVHGLLPRDDAVLQWQRRLGDHAGVSAWQFYGLAESIVNRAAHPVAEVNGHAALTLVRRLLGEMADAGELTTFVQVAQTRGLAQVALEWLREMRTQEITPEQVVEQARRSGSPRDAQLARLYHRYDDFLTAHACVDTDSLLSVAADALTRDPDLAAGISPLLVLGFDQFSPVQLRLLRNLATAGDVTFYLTWDDGRPSDSRVLCRLARTREALLQFAALNPQPIPETPGLPASLRHVRAALLEPGAARAPDSDPGGPAWRLVAAPSREAEVRLALSAIKRLILAGADPEKVALLAPHPDRYAAAVAAVAHEYGVPVPTPRPLAECPPLRAMLNLLALPPSFPWRETFDALRSPYVRHWLSPEQVALLDRLTRERPVVAGRDQWLQALRPPPTRPEDVEDEDRLHLPLYATLPPEELDAIREGLVALFDAIAPPPRGPLRDHVLWLQETVLGLREVEGEEEPAEGEGLITCPRDDDDREALRGLLRTLRHLLEEAALLGTTEEEMDWPDFRRSLVERLRATTLEAAGVAGVRFGPLEAGRAVVVDHLFVLGLSEGEFPAPPTPDPFYHPEERQAYPLPLRRPYPQDDACLWWQVLGTVRRSVTLLRPRFDDSAAPWPPSPYWDAVLDCVEGLAERVEEPPVAGLPDAPGCSAPTELLTALALAGAAAFPMELDEPRRCMEAARVVLAQRAGWGRPGPFEGMLAAPDILADLEARLGDRHLWSASRLNRYGLCPYAFFAAHVLDLEAMPDPEAGLDAMVRGSLLHGLLEDLYRRAVDEGLAPTAADEPALVRRLEEVAEAALNQAPERYGFLSGPLWHHEKAELVRLVAALVRHECRENGDRCRFVPFRQELRFGLPGGDLPPLEIEGEDGPRLRLHGVIDRLDADVSGDLRLIDYKSGSTRITSSDMESGRAVQTPLYALAAETLLGARVVESYYLHLPTRDRSGRLTLPAGASQDEVVRRAAQAALSHAARSRAGRFPVAPDEKGCRYCDAAALCRADRHARAKARQVNDA